MKKHTKLAVLAVSATAVAASAAAAMLTSIKLLSDMAVKKDIPKVFKRIKINISGKEVFNDKLNKEISESSAVLKEECTEKVQIKNRDGLNLSAHWMRCDNPKRIVIAMHGWRSDWLTNFSLCASFLKQEGCSVLFPDQRCHGESEGEHLGFGVFERFDCIDWLNYVIETEPEDIPIYLCGVSMGATTVLMASELDLDDRVRAIISDCGFTSPNDIWKHVLNNNLKIKGNLALSIANYYVNREAKLDTKIVSTVSALSKTKTPVLFIHGDKDSFVPIEMTRLNYEACASEKELLIVKGADHGLSFYVDPQSYKEAVRRLFNKYD